jgi:hypothetical protein
MTSGFGMSWNSGATQLAGYDTNVLQFITASAERMRIDSSGNVGIGTASPTTALNVYRGATAATISVDGDSSVVLRATRYTTDTNPSEIIARKARGTLAAPTTVATSDIAGGVFFQAYGGTNFRSIGRIDGLVQTYTSDTNIAGALAFYTNAGSTDVTERMRINSAGAVLVNTTSQTGSTRMVVADSSGNGQIRAIHSTGSGLNINQNTASGEVYIQQQDNAALAFATNNSERMRIDSSGRVLVGTTSTNLCAGDTEGIGLNTTINGTYAVGAAQFSANGVPALNVNRKTDDGNLVTFSQAGTSEGTISVSGTTVSYNGGHLSRWAQTTAPKDDTLVKGTVLSNLDAMNVYTDADGNPVANEQLNKVKVSDAEGDVNVAGVFVNWTHDDAHDVDEINMAMTGDMIIRIAQGVTVQRGDLLMSAGDGTAKPQGDDICRSKTVAKVTSNHVTCTYADGSYCVPCVLMAC